MGITAKELAARLNLSATAVSMALNGKPGVSTETRALVIREAEKAGYDFSRLSMKKNVTGDIYCIICRAHNAILNYTPIFSELTEGIEQECRKNGYHLKTFQLYEKADDLQKYIEDGKLVVKSGQTEFEQVATANWDSAKAQDRMDTIIAGNYSDGTTLADCSCVLINNAQGAYLATSYLIDRCGRQPGHLCSSYRITNFRERTHGFHRAVREHGMSTAKSIIHELSPSIEGAFSDMLEIIDSGTPLAGAYFADNDLIAIGAIKALKLRGYKIPEAITIAGFDNISEGRVIDPALTTIDVPRKFMGETAAAQLIREIRTSVPHSVKIEVSTTLIKRFSV